MPNSDEDSGLIEYSDLQLVKLLSSEIAVHTRQVN